MEGSRSEERIMQPLLVKSCIRNDVERSFRSNKVTDHSWSTTTTAANSNMNATSFDPIPIITDATKQPSNYDWRIHSLMICRHIITRGLEEGIGSDLTIRAFNRSYRLHRLILDQNSYFKLLLAGGFKESGSSQVTLHLEENTFINAESFQFVLEYLYGKIEEPRITADNVRQVLATCSYFQLMDVCGLCVEYILKTLNHQNVVNYLLFADEQMVKGADRICDAIFTFLCREAYHMERDILAHLPLGWLEKIVESDAFWVPSEYERYQFVLQIIQAQCKTLIKGPELTSDDPSHILHKSIHYMHMTFEQLQSIEHDLHPLSRKPLIPEYVLKEALWQQVQLRSRIESANEKDAKINVTTKSSRRTHSVVGTDNALEEEDTPYYPIPTNDTTTYTGEPALSLASSRKPNLAVEGEYSIYPPFRFSVEFTDVHSLKHGMRIYSDSVFYAGSNWNMYIQKTHSQRKKVLQLGVYLHRQSMSNQGEDPYSFSCYTDKRKVVKTWFKIYCPSRGPKHTLTLFQSSPDNFTVLQSWGWRSTTLCAEENALNNQTEPDLTVTSKTFVPPPTSPVQPSPHETRSTKSPEMTSGNKNAPTLKFTVIMGHV
ncbi:hypothetical protein G6F52_006435 [Rhizopus delemar]|nr:hypothetical protein G6F52_006435 [Rhizopus delemar]